jgi:hypothetical protein
MAVKAAVAVGTLPTSNGSYTDFTVADFGTPDAAIIIVSNASSSSNPAANAVLSVGFWTASAQHVMSGTSLDAKTTSETFRRSLATDVVLVLGSTAITSTECSAASTTNGLRITKDSGSSSLARYATVILLAGLTNEYVGSINLGTGTSAINVTDPGFRADLVFLCSISASGTSVGDHVYWSFGAAHIDAANNVSQAAAFVGSENGLADSNTYSQIRDDCAVGSLFQSAIDWRASIGAHASGFTITPSANSGSDLAYYLAIELPDPDDAFVDIVDSKTSTGDQAYTGTGFTPQLLILAQTYATALDTSINHGFLAIGAGGPATTERCLDYTDEDAQASSDSESEADLSNILRIKSGDGADDAIAALSSFDSDGWTLNYSDGSSSARKILAIAIGDSSTGAVTLTVATSTQAQQSTAVAVTQVHKLTAAASTQVNQSAAVSIGATITLTAAASTQANQSGAVAVSQVHKPAAAISTEAHQSAAAAVTQAHALTAAASTQVNETPAVSVSGDITLVGAVSSQKQQSTSVAITQVHATIAAATSTEAHQSPAVSVSGAITLTASDCTQANTTPSAVVSVAALLAADPGTQINVSGSALLTQAHQLAAATSTEKHSSPNISLGGVPGWLVADPTIYPILTATPSVRPIQDSGPYFHPQEP